MKTHTTIARSLRTALFCGGCTFLALVASTQTSKAAVTTTTINFNSAADVDTAFPTRLIQGGASIVDYDATNKRMHLHAEGTSGNNSNVNTNAYSAATFSDTLNFFENGSITLTFSDVSMSIPSGWNYYAFNFGISNGNSGNLTMASGPSRKFYFQITRDGSKVNLMSGNSTVLATWSFGSSVYNNLESASLTLTATGWSATVTSKTTSDKSGTKEGTFSTPLSERDWNNFYIATYANPATTGLGRYMDAYIGSITIKSGSAIPEPHTVAAILGGIGLVMAIALRKQFRK